MDGSAENEWPADVDEWDSEAAEEDLLDAWQDHSEDMPFSDIFLSEGLFMDCPIITDEEGPPPFLDAPDGFLGYLAEPDALD